MDNVVAGIAAQAKCAKTHWEQLQTMEPGSFKRALRFFRNIHWFENNLGYVEFEEFEHEPAFDAADTPEANKTGEIMFNLTFIREFKESQVKDALNEAVGCSKSQFNVDPGMYERGRVCANFIIDTPDDYITYLEEEKQKIEDDLGALEHKEYLQKQGLQETQNEIQELKRKLRPFGTTEDTTATKATKTSDARFA